MVEKKGKKSTLHSLHITFIWNRCRVVVSFFVPFSIVGQSFVVICPLGRLLKLPKIYSWQNFPIIWYVVVSMNDNKVTVPLTVLHTKWPLYYQWCIFLEFQNEQWLTSCIPEHQSAHCGYPCSQAVHLCTHNLWPLNSHWQNSAVESLVE